MELGAVKYLFPKCMKKETNSRIIHTPDKQHESMILNGKKGV